MYNIPHDHASHSAVRKSILLLDSDAVQKFISKKLFLIQDQEIELRDAQNPVQVLRDLEKEDTFPAVILLEKNLPFMAAWDFIERCRKLNIPSKFFMLASSFESEDFRKAELFPCVQGLIQKPLLTTGVKEILQSFQS